MENKEGEKEGKRVKWSETCALLRYCAVSSGNSSPTFRNNLSVPSSRVKNEK